MVGGLVLRRFLARSRKLWVGENYGGLLPALDIPTFNQRIHFRVRSVAGDRVGEPLSSRAQEAPRTLSVGSTTITRRDPSSSGPIIQNS